MRYLLAIWVMLMSSLAQAQMVVAIKNGVGVTTSGSQAVSGLFAGDIDLIYTVGTVAGGGSIVFSECTVDPLNPSAGCLTTVTSPSVSSATGPAAIKIHAGHSSSVVVAWTVSGSFSATVWLSVQGVTPGEVQGIDGGYPVAVTGNLSVSPASNTFSSQQCSSVSCGSSAPTGLPGDAGMIGVVVSNPLLGQPQVNVGPCNAVDAGLGVPIYGGSSYPQSNNVSASSCCETWDAGVTVSACVVWP